MSLNEALETTKIHSVAGRTKQINGILTTRPFRSPHHTIKGVMPICNIQLVAKKPSNLQLPSVYDNSLGAELKRRRIALEWTQQICADNFGVLKDSYQKWEWNKFLPHIRNRKNVVEFLGYNYWDDGTNSIRNKVLLYRIEHELTQQELAQRIGVGAYSIKRIEGNKGKISQRVLMFISNYLNSV